MTDTTTPDPGALAAELAAIRRMAAQLTDHDPAECRADLGALCTGHDAERMADALEAVLALHQPGCIVLLGSLCARHEACRHFSITRTEAAGIADCGDCRASVSITCTGCPPGASFRDCGHRKAISAALTGEAPRDG